MTNNELRKGFFRRIDNANSMERLEQLIESINWNIKDERSRQLVMAYWFLRYKQLSKQGMRSELDY